MSHQRLLTCSVRKPGRAAPCHHARACPDGL